MITRQSTDSRDLYASSRVQLAQQENQSNRKLRKQSEFEISRNMFVLQSQRATYNIKLMFHTLSKITIIHSGSLKIIIINHFCLLKIKQQNLLKLVFRVWSPKRVGGIIVPGIPSGDAMETGNNNLVNIWILC